MQEERAGVLVEGFEHLVGQVVGYEAVTPAEVAHGMPRVVQPAKPDRREQERGGPPFGPLVEQLDLLRPEIDTPALD